MFTYLAYSYFLLFNIEIVLSSYEDEEKLTPIVETLDGPIVGIVKKVGGSDLNFFLGIPYAKPPIGDLRLKFPEPIDRWIDVLKATKLAPRCMQPRLSLGDVRRSMSEDCFYLNIITPRDSLVNKKAKYPVMISIIHKAHLTGSGDNKIYLKSEIVKRQNIILVTLNSRLNFFGYAKTTEPDSIEGNMGLWDENYAIRWVKNNIEFFGGDPKAITLRGLGSAASNVRAHVLSPYARGLFQNAIVVGRAFAMLGEDRLARVNDSTQIVLDRVGCSQMRNRIQCIQDVDANDIVSALTKRLGSFPSIADRNYLPTFGSAQEDISRANDVNLLMGFDSDYSSSFLAKSIPQIYAKKELTYDDAIEALKVFVEPRRARKIAEIFIGPEDQILSNRRIQQGLVRFRNLLTPAVIYLAALKTAQAENMRKGIYTFEFNHIPHTGSNILCDIDRELGVCHRSEELFAFGEPYSNYWHHTDDDRKMSDIMMNIIGSFMRTGKPKLPNGKEWPNWNDPRSENVNIATIILDSKKGGVVDHSRPKFYLDNMEYVNASVISKYFPSDQNEKTAQQKIDKTSDFGGFLYKAIQSLYFVDY